MRLLKEVPKKPRALILENVKGLKPYLSVLNNELSEHGYTMYYALYNSKFWGVAQNRERYFIVALRDVDWIAFSMPRQQTEFIPKLRDFLDVDVPKNIIFQMNMLLVGNLDIKANDICTRVYSPDGICPTLHSCTSGGSHAKILDNYRVRRFTPREYARLQGFPETYKLVCSDSQMYKMFGNAVTVNVAKAVIEAVKVVL